MGMAHKPPSSSYVRLRHITGHALERLRERSNELMVSHLTGTHLGNLIDTKVEENIREGRVEDIVDRSSAHDPILSRVVTIPEWELAALVRADSDRKNGEVVVTLLTSEMVEANRAHGRWEWLKDTPMGKLKDVKAPPMERRITVDAPPHEFELYIVAWEESQGRGRRVVYREVDEAGLKSFLLGLGDKAENARVYKITEIKLKVEVTLEGT